jgi:hypothetical protein
MIDDFVARPHSPNRILVKARIPKFKFDPTNKKHIESYRHFIMHGTWGEVKFVPEHPHLTVPATVQAKWLAHTLRLTCKDS